MGFRVQERKAVDTPPEERERIYEAAWERGGLQFRASFEDMLVSKEANATAADFIKSKIRSIVKDPRTAAACRTLIIPMRPNGRQSIPTISRPTIDRMSRSST